jgi:hypothetical protein
MGSFRLSCAAIGVSLLAVGGRSGATPRGQPWTSAVMLPHGCNGLSVRRMAVWWTFRAPARCRPVHRELMRSGLLDVTSIIPVNACYQRNYVERYSRSKKVALYPLYGREVDGATHGFLGSCQVCAHGLSLLRSRTITMKASGVIMVMPS